MRRERTSSLAPRRQPDGVARSRHRIALSLLGLALLSVLRAFAPARPRAGSDAERGHTPLSDTLSMDRGAPEAPGVAAGAILATALGFVAFTAVSLGGLYVYFRSQTPGPLIAPQRTFPEPRLQFDPHGDLARLRADQQNSLTGYAWVDQKQGLVRIPIERAMRMIAERGARGMDPLDQPARVPEPGSRGGASP